MTQGFLTCFDLLHQQDQARQYGSTCSSCSAKLKIQQCCSATAPSSFCSYKCAFFYMWGYDGFNNGHHSNLQIPW